MYLLFFFSLLFANVEESIREQTTYYLEEIENNNPSSQKKISFRSGLIQVVGNTPGISLNSEDSLPFLGFEWLHRFSGNWGLEMRGLYGQNILYPPKNSFNEEDKFFATGELGVRYIYEFDPVRKGNYFALKAFYHLTKNNFELEDPSFNILVQEYGGPSFSVERGLSLTEKIHLSASLDLLVIMNLKEESELNIKSEGYGLFVKGEFHYLFEDRNNQLGLSYWQAAYTSELDSTAKVDTGKQNFVTTYRVLSMSYSWLF